jgi:uncharacterized iron-regulated membrane protein
VPGIPSPPIWPLLHAVPHGGDPLGLALLVAVWIVLFLVVLGAIVAVLAWRGRRGADDVADPD